MPPDAGRRGAGGGCDFPRRKSRTLLRWSFLASKSPQSFAKRAREIAVREKRERKREKKAEAAAQKAAAAEAPEETTAEQDDAAEE